MLPQFQYPTNALLDFSPVTNAFARVQDNSFRQAQLENERTRLGYEGERLGMEKGRFQREERDDKMKSLVGSVLAANQATDPVQRKALLDGILAQHPDPAMRSHPVFSDPMKGPQALMADLQAHGINPYALAQSQAGVQHTQAQTGLVGAQTAASMGAEGRAVQMQPLNILEKQRQIEALKVGKAKEDEQVYIQDPSAPGGIRFITPPTPTNPDGMSSAGRKEYDKKMADARAQATVALPAIVDNSERALKTIEQIRSHPGRSTGTGATGMVAPHVPGTSARGFANLVDQATGQTFLEAFNSLRGGGQITEVEGKKATQALARLDRAQNKADFDAALRDLEDVINTGVARARKAAGVTQGPATGPTVTKQNTDRLPQIQPGTIEDGYRFKGGNPADARNWEKVQ